MLSEGIIKHVGIRVKLMPYSGLTVYGWNAKNSQLTPPPNPYMYWNWLVDLAGGFSLCFLFFIQIYIKLSNAEEELVDSSSFATLVLTWGELIAILVICLLATRIYTKQKEIMYVINEMFTFHNQITKWLNERGIQLDGPHKRRIAYGGLVVYFSAYFSYFFPFIIFLNIFHPMEPVHNMLKEWLEFELSFENMKWSYLPLLPPLFVAILGAANTIFVVGVLGTCYYLISSAALEDLTPVRITQKVGRRQHTLETEFYGELNDEEIIIRYRCQQLFNVILNDIVASWRVSLYHVGCLATASIMIYFGISFQNVLQKTGLVGYLIVGGSILAPFAIQYFVAIMFGALVDISEGFKDKVDKLMGRRTLLKVFSRSCVTFFVQEAYPYFNIDKNTFLQFTDQVINYTITLLLW